MKLNKWTMGLVAAGLVSLSVNAEEKVVTTPLLTALSSTTISGYVDTSANWTPGTGNQNPAPYAFNAGKQDGFNLDSVQLVLEKPVEEGQWSSGYKVDLMFGPDAAPVVGSGAGDISGNVKQAYVVLRAPLGNGIDFQFGRMDTILGYEATENYKNPNYTHSYAYTITPTEMTGLLAAYHVSDLLTLKAGVANIENTAAINARNGRGPIESAKAYTAGITLVAPDSAGFLKGSVLNAAIIHGMTTGTGSQVTDLSVNGSIATPLEGLRLGLAWDELFDTGLTHTWDAAVYASFRPAPESKFSFHARGEYYRGAAGLLPLSGSPAIPVVPVPATGQQAAAALSGGDAHIFAATGTIQYDLWQNVISRLEVRWDHSDSGRFFGKPAVVPAGVDAPPSRKNEYTVAANIIYKF